MPRPQFSLRALLVAMLAVACFFGGIRFERERQRREDEAAAKEFGYPDDILRFTVKGPPQLKTRVIVNGATVKP